MTLPPWHKLKVVTGLPTLPSTRVKNLQLPLVRATVPRPGAIPALCPGAEATLKHPVHRPLRLVPWPLEISLVLS